MQKFLTDLSASGKRIESLDAAVEEFVRQGHSQLDKVQARQKQIHQMWNHLNWLKAQKEKSLEGASRCLLFQAKLLLHRKNNNCVKVTCGRCFNLITTYMILDLLTTLTVSTQLQHITTFPSSLIPEC